MRRLQLAFAAGALLGAAVGVGVFAARRGANPVPVTAPAVNPPAPPAAAELPVAPGIELPRPPPAAPRPPAASRAEAELIALEDRALRRIDVVALLEASGVDVRALRKRPDADDVLRRAAGDELLTRRYERFLYGMGAFTPGRRREAAPHDARSAAEELVAGLAPDERAKQLALELDEPAGR